MKVMLCGKGTEENKLKKLAAEFGLQGNITFAGELPHMDILQLMSRSKVILHTSNYEGLPAVCLEALYAGCHVISCIQPVHYEIENWHISNTKEEMVRNVRAILNNPGTRYKPVLIFSIKETAQNIMRLYNYNESRIR
jgi:glycosyltransferase involved in cell wall biosynthesis